MCMWIWQERERERVANDKCRTDDLYEGNKKQSLNDKSSCERAQQQPYKCDEEKRWIDYKVKLDLSNVCGQFQKNSKG